LRFESSRGIQRSHNHRTAYQPARGDAGAAAAERERRAQVDGDSTSIEDRHMHAAATDSLLLAFIIWVVVGAIIGWLAGLLVQGGGFGFVVDALIGILGSVVAGWLFPRIGVPLGGGLIGSVLASVVGAVIVIVVIRVIRRI
jgi:uncharacterized membrane protein YeaQ/YmgE (transglycosylase-associated protein family)